MRSRLAASRTDTFSRKTMRLNLLRVPTSITPVPLLKNRAGYVDNVAQIWSEICAKVAQFSTAINKPLL
jgi:hypothetical protein